MREDLANKLYRRLKELYNQLPKGVDGKYRGYINSEVGNNIKEILDFICRDEVELEYMNKDKIKEQINNILSILPRNSTGKISGYMNYSVGSEVDKLINEVIVTEITPSISPEEKIKIDEIARSINLSCGLFSINSPKRKVSEFCHTIERRSYDRSLLDAIDDINLQSLEGITVLSQAVQKKNRTLIDYLINERKADINARNLDYTTPLHYAIFSNSSIMVKFLLKRGADAQAYAPEPDRINTPLICAFEKGDEDVITVLLENISTDIDSNDIEGLYNLGEEFNQVDLVQEIITRK